MKFLTFLILILLISCDNGNVQVERRDGSLVVLNNSTELSEYLHVSDQCKNISINSTKDTLYIAANISDLNELYLQISEGHKYKFYKNEKGFFNLKIHIDNLLSSVFEFYFIGDVSFRSSLTVFMNCDGSNFKWIGQKLNKFDIRKALNYGELRTFNIESKLYPEGREITIYNPGHIDEISPTIYLTDGIFVNAIAPYVDSLIFHNKILPVKLVGIHSSKENRYFEYVKNLLSSNVKFNNHLNFCIEEIINNPHLSPVNSPKVFFGFSNGGFLSLYLGLNFPFLFDEIIAYSVVGDLSLLKVKRNNNDEPFPIFHMGAGIYESKILLENKELAEKLRKCNLNLSFTKFHSNHSQLLWFHSFVGYIESRYKC